MKEYDKAQKMTKSLEVFYRIGVSKGVDIISFQEELTHVEVYLSILKTRFEDFQYEIEIPEELYAYRVIKLMLQPIVENAIYHGIRPVRLDGLIRIEAKRINNDMQISISDNGAGIPEEMIEQIQNSFCTDRKQTEKTNVYGMRNIHHRIRLIYGSPYGLSIESELEVGTTIHILIPLISKEEN
jgi:sensor histidine kinase YesM